MLMASDSGPEPIAMLMRLPEGAEDSVILDLVRSGLSIPGSRELARLAHYWKRRKAPAFLCANGDDEMFERLHALNVATYRKLGQAKYLLGRVTELFGKVYVADSGERIETTEDIMHQAIDYSNPDEIERIAVFDGFMTSIVSSLDSLAGEMALLLDLPFSIWHIQFRNVAKCLREWASPPQCTPRDKFLLKMKKLVVERFLDVEGCLQDWFEQVVQYRDAAAHRPHMLWFMEVVRRGNSGFRLDHHLYLNTFARQSELIPPPSPGIPMPEVERTLAGYQEQTVEAYCDWVFKHIVSMVSRIYDLLVEVYDARANDPNLFINDHALLLKNNRKPTRFRGFSS